MIHEDPRIPDEQVVSDPQGGGVWARGAYKCAYAVCLPRSFAEFYRSTSIIYAPQSACRTVE